MATVAAVGYATVTRCVFAAIALGAAGGCGSGASAPSVSIPVAIHRIRHVIVIMQENRSFDSYFGTYPGADGIPMRHGRPTVCSPDPISGRCVRPYHDSQQIDSGGPHGTVNARSRHRRWAHERVRRPGRQCPRPGCLHNVLDPNLHHQRAATGRDGLSRRRRHPQLLELRPPVRAAGPPVRVEPRLEPAVPPGDGVRLVGTVHVGQRPHELPLLDRSHDPGRREERRGRSSPGPTSPTCSPSTASAGATTSRRVASPTARTAR